MKANALRIQINKGIIDYLKMQPLYFNILFHQNIKFFFNSNNKFDNNVLITILIIVNFEKNNYS